MANKLGESAMTEAELWHMQLLAVDNSISGVSVLLTVISGYLAVAYFVGRRLGRFQVVLISIFFTLGAGLGAFMTLVQFRRVAYFIEQLNAQFGVHSYMPNTAVNYFSGTLMFLLIPGALFFMYQIRRNLQLGADRDG
jgi:glycerol uptake facilitator-like aquaporin